MLHITPDGVQEEQGGWETRSYCIGKFVGYEVDAVAVVCSNSEGGIQYEARLGARLLMLFDLDGGGSPCS